jgi:hypothetical protein
MTDFGAVAKTDQQAPEDGRRGWVRVIRLASVGIVGACVLGYVLASTYSRSLESCNEQVSSQTGHVVRVCHPVSASDAPVVIGLVLIGLLLLPDFAEVAIPGLVSLKRRVAEQERRQDRLRNTFGSR